MAYKHEKFMCFFSTAKITHPYHDFVRNPRYANQGKFFKLSDFLTYAKDKDLSGIMIIMKVIIIPFLAIFLVDIFNSFPVTRIWGRF